MAKDLNLITRLTNLDKVKSDHLFAVKLITPMGKLIILATRIKTIA